MTSQLGSDTALAGDAEEEIRRLESLRAFICNTEQQRFKMLKKEKSKRSHALLTAGVSQLSTVLKQTGNTAPAAGFSPTPLG